MEGVRDLLHPARPVALAERDVPRRDLARADARDARASHPEEQREDQGDLDEDRRQDGRTLMTRSTPRRVVRALAGDRHVVDVALAQARIGDADESRPLAEFLKVAAPT